MLQRVLGSHPDIHTVSEPWLMLHPLYALRAEGQQSEYNQALATTALHNFISLLPNEQDDYVDGIRQMYSRLYDRALIKTGKQRFLDKTPRYYFVLPELYRIFPEAHYITLFRNPLAVLNSVLDTWVQGDLRIIRQLRHDLVRAPSLLLEGRQFLGERNLAIRYDELVEDPQPEITRICDYLNIQFTPNMIEYRDSDLPRWQYGDQEAVYEHARPTSQGIDKWKTAIADPQRWRFAHDYLETLGEHIVNGMGYPYQELKNVLLSSKPSSFRLLFSSSLRSALSP